MPPSRWSWLRRMMPVRPAGARSGRVQTSCLRPLLALEPLEARTLLAAGHTLATASLPDFHIVNGTAQVAQASGYSCTIVIPRTQSEEKKDGSTHGR